MIPHLRVEFLRVSCVELLLYGIDHLGVVRYELCILRMVRQSVLQEVLVPEPASPSFVDRTLCHNIIRVLFSAHFTKSQLEWHRRRGHRRSFGRSDRECFCKELDSESNTTTIDTENYERTKLFQTIGSRFLQHPLERLPLADCSSLQHPDAAFALHVPRLKCSPESIECSSHRYSRLTF